MLTTTYRTKLLLLSLLFSGLTVATCSQQEVFASMPANEACTEENEGYLTYVEEETLPLGVVESLLSCFARTEDASLEPTVKLRFIAPWSEREEATMAEALYRAIATELAKLPEGKRVVARVNQELVVLQQECSGRFFLIVNVDLCVVGVDL